MDDLRIIIIEDEAASRETLRNYLNKFCKGIEIVTECENIKEGYEAIQVHQPDLVFLDVEMPFGNAFDLLEQLTEIKFDVIFVTAYSQYAIKALNFSASYYLLKPIDIEELERAVEKVKLNRKDNAPIDISLQTAVLLENIKNQQQKDQKIVLPVLDGFEIVDVQDVIRCEANDNFTNFYLTDGTKKVICRTLKHYDEILSNNGFMRVHRSHLINLDFVKSYKKGKGGQVILKNNQAIDVSANRKQDLMDYFKMG